jgi:hypothetical protein
MAKTTKRGSKAKVRSKHALKDLPPSSDQPVKGGGAVDDMMSSLKVMGEILSNVSRTRAQISETFARNSRAQPVGRRDAARDSVRLSDEDERRPRHDRRIRAHERAPASSSWRSPARPEGSAHRQEGRTPWPSQGR